jgi:hypothetical protein
MWKHRGMPWKTLNLSRKAGRSIVIISHGKFDASVKQYLTEERMRDNDYLQCVC